jgi:hypothetical protein
MKHCAFLWAAFAATMLVTSCLAANPSPQGAEFFEKNIRPILADRCFKCHSAQSQKLKAGLYLDSKEGLLKGGDSGPAITPGDPEKSLLIKALRYTDKDLQMPPKEPLPKNQVALFEQWVKMGAPDPRTASTAPVSPPAYD